MIAIILYVFMPFLFSGPSLIFWIGVVPFFTAKSIAGTTLTFSFFIDEEVFAREWMIANAYHDSRVMSGSGCTSKYVFPWRHWLKMVWIYTMTYSAKVIQVFTFWDRSLKVLIHDSMSTKVDPSPIGRTNANLCVTALKLSGSPFKTTSLFVNLDLLNNPVNQRTFSHAF